MVGARSLAPATKPQGGVMKDWILALLVVAFFALVGSLEAWMATM